MKVTRHALTESARKAGKTEKTKSKSLLRIWLKNLFSFIQNGKRRVDSLFQKTLNGRLRSKRLSHTQKQTTRLQLQKKLKRIWKSRFLWTGLFVAMLATEKQKWLCVRRSKLLWAANKLLFLLRQHFLPNSITSHAKTGSRIFLLGLRSFHVLYRLRNKKRFWNGFQKVKLIFLSERIV